MKDYQVNLEVFQEEQVKFVAISVDDRSSIVKAFLQKYGITFTALHYIQNAVNQWRVQVLPTMIIVAPDGTVLLHIWATESPPSIEAMKDYQTNLDSFKEAEIEIITISVDDDLHPIKSLIDGQNFPFPVLQDPIGAVKGW